MSITLGKNEPTLYNLTSNAYNGTKGFYGVTEVQRMDREFTAEDMKKNRTMAALGYLVFFIPLIRCGDSKLGRYCANQGLILWILIILVRLLFQILSVVPFIGWLFTLIGGLCALAGVMVGLLCFAQLMTNDRVIELPFVGEFRLLP